MKKYIVIFLMVVLCSVCKKTAPVTPIDLTPGKPFLSFPLKDEPCITGTTISATQNTVTFTWNSAINAQNYDLVIKNLENGSITTQTTTQTQLAVTLTRNTPYSWWVTSKSSQVSMSASSDVWRFYNSGPGIVYYAPFPAEAITPGIGSSVTPLSGRVSLDWTGTDLDNDIAAYDVYFGTALDPPLASSNLSNSALPNVEVSNNAAYYWKIVTKDSRGNRSESEIFTFRTN